MADTVNYDEVDTLNKFLEESEKIPELVLEPRTVNYKECLLESFKAIQDPFRREIEDVNFDQNPNDPTQLQMMIKFMNNQQ